MEPLRSPTLKLSKKTLDWQKGKRLKERRVAEGSKADREPRS